MSRLKTPLIIQILVFFIPLNIYVIGNWLGTGIQWALFRYQQTDLSNAVISDSLRTTFHQHMYLGNNLIPISQDVSYVMTGVLTGRTAIALSLWAMGTLLFSLATIILIVATMKDEFFLVRKAAICTITGGLILLSSIVVQYGVGLIGAGGFAIPLGIPVVLIIGWWMYQLPDAVTDDADEGEPEDGHRA